MQFNPTQSMIHSNRILALILILALSNHYAIHNFTFFYSGVVMLEQSARELAYPSMQCPITGKAFKMEDVLGA
jgi:hypothetical protein